MPAKKKKYPRGDSAKKAGQRDKAKKRKYKEIYDCMVNDPLVNQLKEEIDKRIGKVNPNDLWEMEEVGRLCRIEQANIAARRENTKICNSINEKLVKDTEDKLVEAARKISIKDANVPVHPVYDFHTPELKSPPERPIPPFKSIDVDIIKLPWIDGEAYMVDWKKIEKEIFKSLIIPQELLGVAVISERKDYKMKIEVVESKPNLVRFDSIPVGSVFRLYINGVSRGGNYNPHLKIHSIGGFNCVNLASNLNDMCDPNWVVEVLNVKLVVS